MPGEFHLDGTADQLMLGSPTAETLAALTGLQITLKANIPPSQGLAMSGGLFYVPWRTVTVLANGHISEDGTNNGIMLLANDPALGLTNPVQWTLHPGRVTLGGKQIKLASWTFQAPAPGVSRTLDQLAPVPNIPAVPVTTFGADQITGATTFGKNLLFLTDAASARTYFGISGSGAEWESYVNLAAFPATGNVNLEYVAQDTGKLYRWNSGTSAYVQIADKAAVGLALVDNTSDVNKPVSTAQAAALLGLVQAAKNPDLLVTGAITVDGSDLMTSAAVAWPDGSPGTLTITSRDSTSAVLGYNITYGSPVAKTYTQPTITRNANGAATNVPAIVVT